MRHPLNVNNVAHAHANITVRSVGSNAPVETNGRTDTTDRYIPFRRDLPPAHCAVLIGGYSLHSGRVGRAFDDAPAAGDK